MASKLPKVGVQTVVENLPKSLLDLDRFNTAVDRSSKKVKEAAKETSPLNRALSNLQSQYQKTTQNALASIPGGEAVSGMLTGVSAGALAAAAAVAVAAVSFVALGNRGAPLIGLAESFDKLTASVGLSSKALLEDLREASRGTVSDFELIRQSNVALAGASGEFGKQFGKNLPKILEIARVQARATGQDVGYLFQSLVTGIKRASPLLIDNTGLVLKIGAANEAYAESIGKTVTQLTEEEKQIAILNATVTAGQTAIDALGNSQEGAAEKSARASASFTNILDTISIAIQPAYSAFLDVVNGILGGIESFARKAAPFINLVAQGFGLVIQFVGRVIKGIGDALTQEGGLGQQLFQGAYNSFKAFGQGISAAVNKLIFPVIIGVAQFIADFLIGFSPPKMGPLSKIDQGGANLMMAWLDGIAGVSLDPVEAVAAEVSEALGGIGKANLKQVEARLATLDKALLPFQNRLEIVKSRFDAIAEPAKAALEAIDRQIAEAEAALAMGDASAAERIRLLDAQRVAIQGNLDTQQALVDRAQIQLALTQSQQAQERALLNIRKAQLQVVQKAGAVADKAPKSPADPKPKAGSGLAPETEPSGGLPGLTMPDTGSVLDDLQFQPQQVIDFAVEFAGEENLADFAANQQALQTQLDRIGTVDVGKKIGDKFKGLTDIFDPGNPDSVVSKITGFVSTLTGTGEGSIADFFTNMPANIEAGVADIQSRISDVFSSIFDPLNTESPAGKAVAFVKSLIGDAETPDSVVWFFAQMPQRISDAASGLLEKIQVDIFDPVSNFLSGTEPGTVGGIVNEVVTFFTDLPARITTALQSISSTLYAGIVVPVVNMFNSMIGVVESGLKSLLTSAINIAQSFVDAIGILAPPELAGAVATLRSSIDKLAIPRIALPALETAPAAATGGMFSEGVTKVGERGTEYVMSASKIGVLPHALTQVLDNLGSIMAQPSPMMVPAGNSYSNSNSSTFNFNGVASDNDARRRYNALRAGMR